jgi:hypothetical protein
VGRKGPKAITDRGTPSAKGADDLFSYIRRVSAPPSWLARPLSRGRCALGWLAATAVFIGLIRLFGGPAEADVSESSYSTWAIAHGHLACAYPPASTYHFFSLAKPGPFIPPIWPILSGGLAALTGIGRSVSFPSLAALGPHCSTASVATSQWANRSGALLPTMRLGYFSWLVLMAGVVAFLRASGRGLCGWEPTVLVLMACIPSVSMPLFEAFHPQDIVAMGFVLVGLACVLRGWWVSAGVLLALAVTSQQFALLVLAPLVLVAPSNRRYRFVGGAVVASALILVPVIAITSGRALNAVVLGSGDTPSVGGTVLWYLHLQGFLLVALSRVLPIGLSIALAWWAVRRLGPTAHKPVPLLSLIATSLSLRLVFEQNVFGYYFMALAVSLVLLDVVCGRIGGPLVAWLALACLAFFPGSWGLVAREYLPFSSMAVVLLLILCDAFRARIRWYLIAWLACVALAYAQFPLTSLPLRHAFPIWCWQVILVSSGLALAVRPLVSHVHHRPVVQLDNVKVTASSMFFRT